MLILAALGMPPASRAQTGSSTLRLVERIGFDGYAKTEVWSPVRVQATNNGPPVEGEIRLTT
ncbi:MAG: hypothetical protein D6796_02640, partial [Caldilineae bacterium]